MTSNFEYSPSQKHAVRKGQTPESLIKKRVPSRLNARCDARFSATRQTKRRTTTPTRKGQIVAMLVAKMTDDGGDGDDDDDDDDDDDVSESGEVVVVVVTVGSSVHSGTTQYPDVCRCLVGYDRPRTLP